MALSATLRRFVIAIADSDREVYETLDLRVAQHPSESLRYLVARLLARALEHGEGVEFSRGLAASDEPAILQHNLQGDVLAWIEIGSPSALRLHRASKTGARIVVYAWRGGEELMTAAAAIHRADELEVRILDQSFLDAIAETVDRKNSWSLTVSGGSIYLECGGAFLESAVRRVPVTHG
jgi:uncharacterized protein YaeQ